MKSTETFKNTIKAYLDQRANDDELFAVTYAKENKNIEDCITYILNEVHKSGCNGFETEEIYSMAVHYYDEDDIEVGKPNNNCRVVVNHTIELSDEEKLEARRLAIEKYQNEILSEITQKSKPTKKKMEVVEQPSLFEL